MVVQTWVGGLSFMQQSVLLCAIRGPDGIHKDHPVKKLLRWYRRCVLYCSFHSRELGEPYAHKTPYEFCGGSFTGPLMDERLGSLRMLHDEYLRCVDELPHHFQLHLMHAVEILGYKYPDLEVRAQWNSFYRRIVNDAHLNPETEEQMDRRLGDVERQWREAEEVTAK
jgi:hypothetical protein